MAKKDIIQIRSPRSGQYIKIDRDNGKILGSKDGPYKNLRIINEFIVSNSSPFYI